MYELPTTPQVPLQEAEYEGGLALAGVALTASAQLVGSRIQVEIHAADGRALVARAVIALPRAARLQAHERAAADPMALHYPI